VITKPRETSTQLPDRESRLADYRAAELCLHRASCGLAACDVDHPQGTFDNDAAELAADLDPVVFVGRGGKVTTSRLSPLRVQPPSSRANNVGEIELYPVQPRREARAEGDGGLLGVPPPHAVSARLSAAVLQTRNGTFIVTPLRIHIQGSLRPENGTGAQSRYLVDHE
jgi:hypothetical protein